MHATIKINYETFNLQEGILSEFRNHFGDVEFFNKGDQVIFNIVKDHVDSEILDSPEVWSASFMHNNFEYAIIADGEITSSGKYVVACIKESR